MDNPGRVGSLLLAEKDIISDEVSRILLLLFCNIETDCDHSGIRLMHQVDPEAAQGFISYPVESR